MKDADFLPQQELTPEQIFAIQHEGHLVHEDLSDTAFQLPEKQHLDLGKFVQIGILPTDAENIVGSMYRLIERGIVRDRFGENQEARDAWIDQMNKTYGPAAHLYLKKNSLVLNQVGGVKSNLQFLRMTARNHGFLPEQNALVGRIDRLIREFEAVDFYQYKKLSYEERIGLLKNIFRKLVEFLKTLQREDVTNKQAA